MKIRKIVIFCVSLIACVVLSCLRKYSTIGAAIIISGIYSLGTYFVLKKYGNSIRQIISLTFLIVCGYAILTVPIHVFDFEGSKPAIWGTLCALITPIFTAIYYAADKNKLILSLFLIIWLYAVTLGHETWWEYAIYGNYKKGINISCQKLATDKDSLCMNSIAKKYILLDFWSTTCGVCFERFPEVQELYNNLEGNENVLIASVFIASNGECYSDGSNILKEHGYTFPVMGCTDWKSSLISTLGIKGVPHVIILNENKEVIFRGSIKFAKRELNKLLN